MDDVKIKVIDSDKLINAINEGSYDINLSAVVALGAVMLDTKKQNCHEDFDKYVKLIERSAQPEIIRCKDCKHRPTGEKRDDLEFPDDKCPCKCEDYWYSWKPSDNWFCGNGERKERNDND